MNCGIAVAFLVEEAIDLPKMQSFVEISAAVNVASK